RVITKRDCDRTGPTDQSLGWRTTFWRRTGDERAHVGPREPDQGAGTMLWTALDSTPMRSRAGRCPLIGRIVRCWRGRTFARPTCGGLTWIGRRWMPPI